MVIFYFYDLPVLLSRLNYFKSFVNLLTEIMQKYFSLTGYHVKIKIIAKMEIFTCFQHRPLYKDFH